MGSVGFKDKKLNGDSGRLSDKNIVLKAEKNFLSILYRLLICEIMSKN